MSGTLWLTQFPLTSTNQAGETLVCRPVKNNDQALNFSVGVGFHAMQTNVDRKEIISLAAYLVDYLERTQEKP
jgi:hypothetical protein